MGRGLNRKAGKGEVHQSVEGRKKNPKEDLKETETG